MCECECDPAEMDDPLNPRSDATSGYRSQWTWQQVHHEETLQDCGNSDGLKKSAQKCSDVSGDGGWMAGTVTPEYFLFYFVKLDTSLWSDAETTEKPQVL